MLTNFESIRYIVQKNLCRLEFPDFPEGNSNKTFYSIYQSNKRLTLKGGSYGTLYHCTHRETGKEVAVKCINRKKIGREEDARIFSEIAILANMKHSSIIKIIDFFEEQGHYFIVLEYLNGPVDLFDRIARRKYYNENDARNYSAILLDAINYCHRNSVAHLHLKPENLVLTSENDDTEIKLVDFRYAQKISGRTCLRRCSTPTFVAPEIICDESYPDERADMWSVGVIIYTLLGGRKVYKNALGEVELKGSSWNNVSHDAKKLVLGLLDRNPNTRMTAKEAISSNWFKQRSEQLKRINLQESRKNLSSYNTKRKLKAVTNNALLFANRLVVG